MDTTAKQMIAAAGVLILVLGAAVYHTETVIGPRREKECVAKGMKLDTIGSVGGSEYVCVDKKGQIFKFIKKKRNIKHG